MVLTTTLEKLRSATIAHTDAGPYYVVDGDTHSEAIVKGVVSKARPSLCRVDVEGEMFTTTTTRGFEKGDAVLCRLSLDYKKGMPVFTILSMRHEDGV